MLRCRKPVGKTEGRAFFSCFHGLQVLLVCMEGPCQVHDHGDLRNLEYVYLKTEQAQCSPCSVDVLSLDESQVHMEVQDEQKHKCQEEAHLREETEDSYLLDVVESYDDAKTEYRHKTMILHDLNPAVVGEQRSRREYGQYRYEHKKENDYPYNLVSFHSVDEFPEALSGGLRLCVPVVFHISKGFLQLP